MRGFRLLQRKLILGPIPMPLFPCCNRPSSCRAQGMRRRDFITLLSGTAAWPVVALAQEPERVRRIGVLSTLSADDPEGKARIVAFQDGLQQLGWIDGRNLRIDYRWGARNPELLRKDAAEL